MTIVKLFGLQHNLLHNLFVHWDSKYYLDIILHGYMSKPSNNMVNWVYFPLFPLTIHLLSFIPLNPIIIGILFNQIVYFCSLFVIYKYATKLLNFDQNTAELALLLLALSMVNIHFSILYTEALFLFLSTLTFYNLRKGNYWLSALFSALLSATRFMGFLFIFAFILQRIYTKSITKKNFGIFVIQLFLSISGLLLFMLYLHYRANDSLAFYHGQIYWGKTQTHWLTHPLQTLFTIFHNIPFYYILFIIMSIYISFKLWIKKMYPELVFLALSLLAPIAAGTFFSYGRYFFILFPVYLIIANNVISHRIISYFLISAFAMFNFIFYAYLMTSNF